MLGLPSSQRSSRNDKGEDQERAKKDDVDSDGNTEQYLWLAEVPVCVGEIRNTDDRRCPRDDAQESEVTLADQCDERARINHHRNSEKCAQGCFCFVHYL